MGVLDALGRSSEIGVSVRDSIPDQRGNAVIEKSTSSPSHNFSTIYPPFSHMTGSSAVLGGGGEPEGDQEQDEGAVQRLEHPGARGPEAIATLCRELKKEDEYLTVIETCVLLGANE